MLGKIFSTNSSAAYCSGYLFLYRWLVMCTMKPDSPQPRKNGPAPSSLPLVTSSHCSQSNSCGLSWTSSQIRAEQWTLQRTQQSSPSQPGKLIQLPRPCSMAMAAKAGMDEPWAEKGCMPLRDSLQLTRIKWSRHCKISYLLLFRSICIGVLLQVIWHVIEFHEKFPLKLQNQ